MPSSRRSGGPSGGAQQLDSAGAGASDSAAAADAAGFAVDAERGMSMTLAADLLGMPSLPGEFNAKVRACDVMDHNLPGRKIRLQLSSCSKVI